jgi:hypothetical protein
LRRVALAALASAGALGGACGNAPQPSGTVRALVTRLGKDSMRFTTPATARRCAHGGGVVLQGATGGNGAIAWLRTPDSLAAGSWVLLQRGDTVSRRGATLAVRWVAGDIARGAALDSGRVAVVRTARDITVRASGSGLEASIGRVMLEATFAAVPLVPDTVTCAPRQ